MEISRPALGEIASLGTLYDARYDQFRPYNLFGNPDEVQNSVQVTPNASARYEYRTSRRSSDRMNHIDVRAGLRASFLAGTVSINGSGQYLNDTSQNHNELAASMQFLFATRNERISINAPDVKSCIKTDALTRCTATHVVTGIRYGAQAFVTARYQLAEERDRSSMQGDFRATIERLSLGLAGQARGDVGDHQNSMEESFQISVYTDQWPPNIQNSPTNFRAANEFINELSRCMGADPNEGIPLTFTLSPLADVQRLDEMNVRIDSTVRDMASELLNKYTSIFDDLQEVIDDWTGYYQDINNTGVYIPSQHRDDTRRHRDTINGMREDFQGRYRMALERFRMQNDLDTLQNLPAEIRDEMRPFMQPVRTQYQDKIRLYRTVVAANGRYTRFMGTETQREVADQEMVDVFYFDGRTETIEQYSPRLVQLLGDREASRPVWVVDCEDTTEQARMVRHRKGTIIKPNVLQEQELLANEYVMRCDPSKVNRVATRRPAERRPVRIPCPTCDQTVVGDWLCLDCEAPVEYGFSDTYMYCGCGKVQQDAYRFHCPLQTHGAFSTAYEPDILRERLEDLDAFPEMNILLLGETGAGKSTFINAFANYVCYTTLNEASTGSLQSVIPFSFRACDSVTFEERAIGVEMNDDEHDASQDGQSATQRTTVHCFRLGDTLVRLIDTPGIGDTRGRAQDEANLRDMLSVLLALKKIHGILYLVNGTANRLTDRFNYCIETLLGELDSNLANLMVFGFTHTTNLTQATARSLVLRRLRELPNSPFTDLGPHQMYTFESESFRYLAAHREDFQIGDLDNYVGGWRHSRGQCQRLIQHFYEGPVWNLETTVSIGYCRRVMEQISQPVIDTADLILRNMTEITTATNILNSLREDGERLQQFRYIPQTSTLQTYMAVPNIVCDHPGCVRRRTENEVTCEEPRTCCIDCQIAFWTPDALETRGHSALKACIRFGSAWLPGSTPTPCQTCRHPTTDHRLTRYRKIDERKMVLNPTITDQLQQNSLDMSSRQQLIEGLQIIQDQYQAELRRILDFTASLSVFLGRRSFALYQDPLQVRLNGISDPSEAVQRIRTQYTTALTTLTALEAPGSDSGLVVDTTTVQRILRELYLLRHFGSSLRSRVSSVEAAQDRTQLENTFPIVVRGWELSTPPASGGNPTRGASGDRRIDAASQLGGGLPTIVPVAGQMAQ